ncbi:hypothetical protein BDQ17DRAFT_1429390 [Cyathus striatus]|nr:hypothetical protein BDQ17DRAFT_1429390 [Cyathus striatus]
MHRDDRLLNRVYPKNFRVDVDNRWRQRNISLVLGDEIETIPEYPTRGVTTRKGVHIDAELVISCRGGGPNTAFIASIGPVLSPGKRIIVDRSLQVKGLPGVFAAGDITEWNEAKQVAKYGGHATTITKNIKGFLSNKSFSSSYRPMFEVLSLSNGSNGGTTYLDDLWGLHFGDRFTRMMKSGGLFISQARKALGYTS